MKRIARLLAQGVGRAFYAVNLCSGLMFTILLLLCWREGQLASLLALARHAAEAPGEEGKRGELTWEVVIPRECSWDYRFTSDGIVVTCAPETVRFVARKQESAAPLAFLRPAR